MSDWATGDVFVALSHESLSPQGNVGYNGYGIFDNSGNYKEDIPGFPDTTSGNCAFDTNGNLFGITIFNDTVVKISKEHPHNILQTINISVDGVGPGDITFANNGDFYVSTFGGVWRFNAAGVKQQEYPSLLAGSIELSSDQRTLFYPYSTSSTDGRIKRYDVVANVPLSDFANIGGSPRDIKLLLPGDGSTGLLVADGTTIKRLNAAGSVIQTYSMEADRLALDPNGTSFWVNWGHSDFARFNIATGAVEVGPLSGGRNNWGTKGICVIPGPTNYPRANELRCGGSPSEHSTTETEGDGVNTATGSYCYEQEGLLLPSRGVPLQFQPSYSSDVAATTSRLGNGWTHNYNMYIDLDEGQNYRVHEENGSVVTFGSDFSHPSRVMATLTEEGTDELAFTRLHGQDSYYFTAVEGRSVIYRLDRIIDRNGHKTSLDYENGLLHRVADNTGRALDFQYYSNGLLEKVTEQIDSQNGRDISFEYDPDPTGGVILRDPPSELDPAPEANLTAITDIGDTRRAFTYDSQHHLKKVTEPRNGMNTDVLVNSYGGPDGNQVYSQDYPMSRHMEFGYSSSNTGTQTRITNTLGLVTLHDYSSNLLESVTQYPGDHQAKWSYSYQLGTPWIASVTDPLTHTWGSTWDMSGNLLSETDPLMHTTSYSYNSTNDLILMTNAATLTTTYTYDTYGNLTGVSRPHTETGQTLTTQYGYDYTLGSVGDLLSVTDPLNHTWHYSYGAYGYPRTTTDPLGNISYTYFDAVGRLHSSVDANGNPTVYSTNDYGDPLSVTNALLHSTVYTYDAVRNLTSTRDAKGNVTTNAYNFNNELTRVTQPDGTHSDYLYDGVGRVISQSNGLEQVTIYTYDDLNREYRSTDPLGRTHQYRHDLAGRLDREQDASGRYTNYYYYPDNRLQTVDYTDGVTHDVGYTYDDRGLRNSMTDGTGTTSYVYDSLDRLKSVSEIERDQKVVYDYDPAGNIFRIQYPDVGSGTGREPRWSTRTFDQANRLKTVSQFSGVVTTFDYDSNGNLKLIDHQVSTVGDTDITYDALNRPKTIISGDSGSLVSIQYDRDPNGLVITSTERAAFDNGTLVHSYSYDAQDRLQSETTTNQDSGEHSTNTWLYDAASQITTTLTYTSSGGPIITTRDYDPANQLIELKEIAGTLTVLTQTFAYDNEGNRSQDVTRRLASQAITTTYAYNQADHLIDYANGQTYATYKYNGDGLRVEEILPGAVPITYVWDILGGGTAGLPLLLRETHLDAYLGTRSDLSYFYSPSGQPLSQIIDQYHLQGSSPGQVPDGVTAVPPMNGNEGENRPELADYSYYFYGDGLGSVRVVEDFLGRIYSAFLYDAYGVRRCSRANGDGGCEIYPSFGFAGQFTDGASGLQYLRARYYDPQTQQFLTKDPLERITGQPYVYAYGNPVNYTDPTGMSGGGSNQQLPPEPIRGGQLPTVGAGRALESGMEGGLLIDYGRIDRSGRPTGIEAIITREMLGTGSEADSSIVPPGFKGREEGHARGHLLGKQLGGSGSVRRNLVTLFQRPVNTPIMSKFEGQVAAAVRSGETVWYRATPIYRGAEGMPYAITLEAQGSGGFSLGVSIFNRVLRP